jgi:hypothetical protein
MICGIRVMRTREPHALKMRSDAFDGTSVEDASLLHENGRIEYVEDLRGRLVDGAEDGGVAVGDALQDLDQVEGTVAVCDDKKDNNKKRRG